jgi:PAS domain S-box-containing protein
MLEQLKVLLAEDSERDALLVLHELKREGFDCESRRVKSEPDLRRELQEFRPHIVLSDFSMPPFNGIDALRVCRELVPDTPFIFVSGTIGESVAVEAMRAGADDYVMKTNLIRLGPAVRRELREVETRRARRVAEAALRRAQIIAKLAHVITNPDGSMASWSETLSQLAGVEPGQLPKSTRGWMDLLHPDDRPRFREAAIRAAVERKPVEVHYRLRKADGTYIHVRQDTELLQEPPPTEGSERWFHTLQDVTEQRAAEWKIRRLNRVYAVLSGINALIVRARGRDELCQGACRIAAAEGSFPLAWIGLLDNLDSRLKMVAWEGDGDGFIDRIPILLSDQAKKGRGLARQAIVEGKAMLANDIASDERVLMREESLARGFRSFVALPLAGSEGVMGLICLFAEQTGFFDEEEMQLLLELAANLSFALEQIGKLAARNAELRESEERFRAMVSGVKDYAIIMLDPDGHVVTWNEGARAMKGYEASEIVGQSMKRFYAPEDVASGKPDRVLAQASREGRVEDQGWRLRKDGTRFYADVAITAIRGVAGELVGYAKITRDITERRQAEIALVRAHEMARLAHIVTGKQGAFENWSQTLPSLVAIEPHALPRDTRDWLALMHPEDREIFRAIAIEATRSGTRQELEYRLQRGDGRWIHLRQVIEPIDLEARTESARWISTLQDVSAEKQAEQRIRGQLEHLRLLDQITRATGERLDLKSTFGVVVTSLENSLAIDFACLCLRETATGTLVVNTVGTKSRALATELALIERAAIEIDENGLSRCMAGRLVYEPDLGQVPFPFAERLARGGLRSVVLAPLRAESQVFGALIVARREAGAFTSTECEFLRQLSEHVALSAHQAQLYESLQKSYDELRRTQEEAIQQERLRSVGQMASGIAHDINNTLSPVSLYTESMLETEKSLSDGARQKLETIRLAVEDVAKTVARMREFYRARDEQIELTPVDVNRMARQVLDLTKPRWHDMTQAGGIVIKARLEPAADLPKIMGVENEIREALTNLVFNAVDAMPEGGSLTLRTRQVGAGAGASVILEVVDTGAGMDEETRKRCLEPFYTTKGERGTGLGLAMVFGMVQRVSAGIEIDSAPGMGTTVRLMFAVAKTSLGPEKATAPIEAPKHLRLLLVDDDPVLIKALRETLEADGHAVTTASGGQAGIDAFRAGFKNGERYTAVITDLGMPYVDGRKVAAAVKESSPDTPVIMLTGWGERMKVEGDIPADVDWMLSKPPKLRELREAFTQLFFSLPRSG